MARRSPKARRRSPQVVGTAEPVVVVCRGGDCGSRTKHPGVDHLAQLRVLRGRLEGAAEVVSSSCLDACEHSNVVVVLPGRPGRDAGGQPVWIGEVLDPETTEDLAGWVLAGGPAVADEPVAVDVRTFRPSRLNRLELDEATGRPARRGAGPAR